MWWCGLPGSYEVGDVLHLFVSVFRCKRVCRDDVIREHGKLMYEKCVLR